jgi:hypothetical protein
MGFTYRTQALAVRLAGQVKGRAAVTWLLSSCLRGSGTASGVLALERGFPVVVPPLPWATTGYPLATLRVGLGQSVQQKLSKLQ